MVRGMSNNEAQATRVWLRGYHRRQLANKPRQEDGANFHLAQERLYRNFAANARTVGVKRYWQVAATMAALKAKEAAQ